MRTFNFTTNAEHNKDILIKNNWFEDIEDEQIPSFFKQDQDEEPTPMIFLESVDEFLYTDEDLFINEELSTPPTSPREQLLLTNYPHNQEEIIQYDITEWFNNTEEQEEEEEIEHLEYIQSPITQVEEEEDTICFPEENEDFTKPDINTFYRVRKTTNKFVYITKLTQDTLTSEYDEIMRKEPFRKKLNYNEDINRYYIFIEPNNKRESNMYYFPPLLKKE